MGVEPALPLAAQGVLADECPEVRLHDATAAIESARRLKTTHEIGLLRQAIALADAGQRRLHELAAEGGETTDSAIWADVVAAVQTLAGRPVPVVGAIVTGTRTAVLTSPGPAGVQVVPGDLVLLDIGPRLGGYWADCCNTLVFGAEPDAAQLRYLRATRESCEAAIDALRPSRPCSDAANAVRVDARAARPGDGPLRWPSGRRRRERGAARDFHLPQGLRPGFRGAARLCRLRKGDCAQHARL